MNVWQRLLASLFLLGVLGSGGADASADARRPLSHLASPKTRAAGGGRTATPNVWDTRETLLEDFAAVWSETLAESPHAHFALDLEYLAWEAAQGRHARALMFDDHGRRGLMVVRQVGGRWVSGWPWRWQALVRGADPGSPFALSEADAAWLHHQASRVAAPAPLTTFLPHPPPSLVPGFGAGATVIQELDRSDEELLQGMDASKRRLLKRALGHDLESAPAQNEDDFRAFHRLQQEVKQRRGLPKEHTPDHVDRRGGSWREWELPWMWLLTARRNGEILAGVGDGMCRGGAMQARAAASTIDARRMGATVLLGYEEARRGRDLGHRWLNHGGDTPFKREMSGRLGRSVATYAWLGGGSAWRPWQHGEAAIRSLRGHVARWRRERDDSRPSFYGWRRSWTFARRRCSPSQPMKNSCWRRCRTSFEI